ncbi:PDR/VanB family oxidoreductase [Gordonia sp. PKS22-38]|uniref:PDR/VanB family oxidoreductase n=1 Tax=Gordonia prachuapensis TaxID=3115651 RepID=A0ABU7N0M2_9ACTN|nr:PDR/VanB family oxidoreductase [Gordonia sp. PKS22-38]
MANRRSATRVPEQLYGRPRADYTMAATRALFGAWMPVWERFLRYDTREHATTTIDVEVSARTPVSADGTVVELLLRPACGTPLPSWAPGAHIRILLPSGRIREYSLCGRPADAGEYRIAVRRISESGGSAEVHDLQVGGTVRITHPLNAFPLALPGHGSAAARLHFIAGGIGITPILPMIETAEAFGVPWTLTYLGRSTDSLAYLERLAGLNPEGRNRIDIRTDDVAGIPTATGLIDAIGDDAAVYFCGPPSLTDGLLAALRTAEHCAEIHFERFGLPTPAGREFEVSIAGRNTLTVAHDESMLTALLRAAPAATYSCRQGFCGTCKVRVLDGEVEHADSVLTDHERQQGFMLPCVSRAADDSLTIDL